VHVQRPSVRQQEHNLKKDITTDLLSHKIFKNFVAKRRLVQINTSLVWRLNGKIKQIERRFIVLMAAIMTSVVMLLSIIVVASTVLQDGFLSPHLWDVLTNHALMIIAVNLPAKLSTAPRYIVLKKQTQLTHFVKEKPVLLVNVVVFTVLLLCVQPLVWASCLMSWFVMAPVTKVNVVDPHARVTPAQKD